jgi:hypothetical protein
MDQVRWLSLVLAAASCGAVSAASGKTVRQVPVISADRILTHPCDEPAPLPFGAFERLHTVGKGQLMVPARDYAAGLAVPIRRPGDEDSSRIYDVEFLGADDATINLAVRKFRGVDPVHPDTSRRFDVPVDAKTIRVRHLIFTIKSVSPGTITYALKIDRSAVGDVSHDSPKHGDIAVEDYQCRAMRDAPPPPTLPPEGWKRLQK